MEGAGRSNQVTCGQMTKLRGVLRGIDLAGKVGDIGDEKTTRRGWCLAGRGMTSMRAATGHQPTCKNAGKEASKRQSRNCRFDWRRRRHLRWRARQLVDQPLCLEHTMTGAESFPGSTQHMDGEMLEAIFRMERIAKGEKRLKIADAIGSLFSMAKE
ncbi:hypothetical protein BDW66DRAFT_3820 [Aspergillus desertorum]